jgi:heterogeneous nuclear rnp K-like protein
LIEPCTKKNPAMPESESNRKRSRSPSDSEQPKQHKRANTGAPAHTDESPAPTPSNPQLAQSSISAVANDVNMTDPSSTAPTDSAVSATSDTTKETTEAINPMAASSNPNASTLTVPTSASGGNTPPSAHIHMRCLIVTQDASIIIGKGGAHVNEIREKSGARVMVSESIPGNPERILNVSGPLDAVSKVRLARLGVLLIFINQLPSSLNRLLDSLSDV